MISAGEERYDEMKRSAGDAIRKLNEQYAAKANAAAEQSAFFSWV